MSFFHESAVPALDEDGNPINGAVWQFTLTGTTTPTSVYANNALTVSLGSTEESNAAGRFVPIFLDDNVVYRARLWPDNTLTGTPIKDIDPINDINNTSVDTVDDLTDLAAPATTGRVVDVRGYYSIGDGGGGPFRWDAASTATEIDGLVLARAAGGTGRWFRIHDGRITTRMTGARINDTDFDDDALRALGDYLTAYDDCRHIVLSPGTYRLAENDGTAPGNLIVLSGIDGLMIDCEDAIFNIEVDQTELTPLGGVSGRSNFAIFDFTNCQNTKFRGSLKLTAVNPFTPAYMIANGTVAGKGTIGVQFHDDCSNSECDTDATGILMGQNWVRAPRTTIDPIRAVRITDAGTGYTVGDTLTLSNVGPPSGAAVAATTNATFTVATVGGGGAVTSLTKVNRGVFPSSGNIGLNTADVGFPLTGGTGSNIKIVPYLADYDLELYNADPNTGSGHSRHCISKNKARNCYYGFHANYNFSDSYFESDTDYIYRGAVIYGGSTGVTFRFINRHCRGDSLAGGSVKGLGSTIKGHVTQLPCTDTAFNSAAATARVAYANGLPSVVDWDLDYSVNTGTGSSTDNYYGTLFEVEKLSLNGSDSTQGRGHIGRFSLGGSIIGSGRVDSGLGANVLFGTIGTVGGTIAWTGEELHWLLKDGLFHRGLGTIIVDAKCLGSFTVGRIDSDGGITTDSAATAAVTAKLLTPTGPISLHPDATFRNRYSISAFAPCMGDIVLSANCTIGANLSGHRFHVGNGTGTTITVDLPAVVLGHRWRFMNGVSTASSEVHISPNGSDSIADGATVGAGGKNWRLTGLGASVELEAFRGNILSITNSYGTQSIEP
jgi:hypothetical protein